mgnify:FL=1
MINQTNYYDNLLHHQNAKKALDKAKQLEAEKLKTGAKYQNIGNNTWVLKQGSCAGNETLMS